MEAAEDMSGMSLTPETVNGTKLFRIREVVANTPASEAGLQADDLITAIDGQPAADFTEGHIERMFTHDGQEFALTIKRGEKLLQAKLKLRRLIWLPRTKLCFSGCPCDDAAVNLALPAR